MAKTTTTTMKTKKTKKTKKAKTAKKAVTFGVSIQKILEKMKAIVDGKKEEEFLQKCAALGDDRFVTVNSRIVRLVKTFEAEHGLQQQPPSTVSLSTTAAASPKASAENETCFKH